MKEHYTLAIEILKGFSHSASICQVLLCLRGYLGGGKARGMKNNYDMVSGLEEI